ncbi:MAG: TetR/AcrR family transcriptional regulator [Chloroflexota bacterium]
MKKDIDLRAKRTRRWLQNALRELVQKKSYHKITIGEIVTKAEVARTTFYLHFESKDELLLSLFDNLFTEFEAELNKELTCAAIDWPSFGKMVFTYAKKNAESIRTLLDAGVERQVQERFQRSFITLGQKARATDPIIWENDIVASYMEEFIASGLFTVIKRWVLEDMPIPAEKLGVLTGEAVLGFRSVRERELQEERSRFK